MDFSATACRLPLTIKGASMLRFGPRHGFVFFILTIGLLLSACGGSSVHVTAKNATLVSIGVTPANPNLPQGLTRQFTATGTYSDNSTQDLTAQVAWSSSNTGVATIDSAGLATSVAAGTTTITATMGGVSGSTTPTVTAASLSTIAVIPTASSIANGTTRQFTATPTHRDSAMQDLTTQVAWSSSSTGVATIRKASGSKGLATSVAAGGPITITATLGSVSCTTTNTCATLTVTSATLVSIGVTPTNPGLPLGSTQQFTATGTYSDCTTQDQTARATWRAPST